MRFGRWADFFEAYKEIYNFEKKNLIFKTGDGSRDNFGKKKISPASEL
jgi:hypothetical protein